MAGLCAAGKRLRVGDVVKFAPEFAAEIVEKREGGEVLIRFSVEGRYPLPRGRGTPSRTACFRCRTVWVVGKYGEPPLPPYIKRQQGAAKQDVGRYQTIYAARQGAVAAPTAGLHFTPELLARLDARGVEQVTVTLHVGAGTFLPVKADYLKDHVMHAEYGEVSAATAEAINKARTQRRRIVSVGTTSLRILESAADEAGVVHEFAGDTAIFITPVIALRQSMS